MFRWQDLCVHSTDFLQRLTACCVHDEEQSMKTLADEMHVKVNFEGTCEILLFYLLDFWQLKENFLKCIKCVY